MVILHRDQKTGSNSMTPAITSIPCTPPSSSTTATHSFTPRGYLGAQVISLEKASRFLDICAHVCARYIMGQITTRNSPSHIPSCHSSDCHCPDCEGGLLPECKLQPSHRSMIGNLPSRFQRLGLHLRWTSLHLNHLLVIC